MGEVYKIMRKTIEMKWSPTPEKALAHLLKLKKKIREKRNFPKQAKNGSKT